MTDNIINLDGKRVHRDQEISEGMDAMLDEFTSEVKAGNLKAVTIAAVRSDGGVFYRTIWGRGENALPLMGVTAAASHWLADLLDEYMMDES